MVRICFHRRRKSVKKTELSPNHYEKCCEIFNLMLDRCQFWGEETCCPNLNLSSSLQAIWSSISKATQINTDAIEHTSKLQNKSINNKKKTLCFQYAGNIDNLALQTLRV